MKSPAPIVSTQLTQVQQKIATGPKSWPDHDHLSVALDIILMNKTKGQTMKLITMIIRLTYAVVW